jgi:hypothetical protein
MRAVSVQQPDARLPAGGADPVRSQYEGLCLLGPRVPTESAASATTLPWTVLVHMTSGPSGVVEVEISFQPAIRMLALAPATTVAAG